jgi:NAD(P)-dependent dehydrogenase (short-subunit alcohol dehydrogenase family)
MILDGKTAIITGAGSGLGLAMTRLFVAEGARVTAVDIDAQRLESLAELPSVVTVSADVSKPQDADRIVAAAGSRIDILCNNAGVLDRLAPADELTDDEWERVIAINLTGPFLLSRRVIPTMRRQGAGVILNTASIAGLRGGRAGAAYTASKYGLVGLTQNIAWSYAKDGIRCNAICPGSISTNIYAGVEVSPKGREVFGMTGDWRPEPADPETVAGVALFLVSDQARHVNGVALPIDAGRSAY